MDALRRRAQLLLVLLVAAFLRLYGLNNLSPPGLAHDEVANWLIDRGILAGQHAVYFTQAYGHEAGFHYVQALFVALLGDHALALRLPAAFAGLLLVAVSYALTRRLFGHRVAVLAAALLAVLFWPVFFSRLGLRAIFLPLLSTSAAYAWWRSGLGLSAGMGTSGRHPDGAWRWLLLAGLLAGATLYTYMAARSVPIFFAVFLVYLAIFYRRELQQNWAGVLLFWLAFLVVAAPLLYFLWTNPGAEFRISEVDLPLRALQQGDPEPVLENSLRVLGIFGVQGDPLWRQNVARQPVFGPLLAILFYAGLGVALLGIRNARYAFLLLWIAAAAIPSIVTIDAPSSIRMINVLPMLAVPPALVIHRLSALSTETLTLSTAKWVKIALSLLTILLLLFYFGRTAGWIFRIWPGNEAEVQFVWQKALTEVARHLDATPTVKNVSVGGWTPDSMDPPTMALSLRRDDLSLRFFYPPQALIVANRGPAEVVMPAALPLAPWLHEQVEEWHGQREEFRDFTAYSLDGVRMLSPEQRVDVQFGDELYLMGYDVSPSCYLADGEICTVLTQWEVMAPASGPWRFFLHVLDGSGNLVAQDDRLDAPAAHWQSGDLLLQQLNLSLDTLSGYQLRLGVYDPESEVRLEAETGEDSVLLQSELRK